MYFDVTEDFSTVSFFSFVNVPESRLCPCLIEIANNGHEFIAAIEKVFDLEIFVCNRIEILSTANSLYRLLKTLKLNVT